MRRCRIAAVEAAVLCRNRVLVLELQTSIVQPQRSVDIGVLCIDVGLRIAARTRTCWAVHFQQTARAKQRIIDEGTAGAEDPPTTRDLIAVDADPVVRCIR